MTVEDTRSRARQDGGPLIPKPGAQPDNAASQLRERRNALVGEQVLHALGEPGDLLKVQARPLWKDNYRVNVFVGAHAACARIAHSYFVVTDDQGKVLDSAPKIERRYEPR